MGFVAEMPVGKKMGRPKGKRDDVSVKLNRQLATMARVLAASEGITSVELISNLLRGPLVVAYQQRFKDLAKDDGEVDR